MKTRAPIIGQEALCPDGLGRVSEVRFRGSGVNGIRVQTYIRDRSCVWDAHNVTLIAPGQTLIASPATPDTSPRPELERAWSMESDAALLAANRHKGQTRKYTGEPYVEHCRRVAGLVKVCGGSPEQVAAAWLHDVLEDTIASTDEITKATNREVADLVIELTDVYTPELYPKWNRARRKAAEAARLSGISAAAKLIKVCDILDNTDLGETIPEGDDFRRVWLQEKHFLLHMLRKS